MSDFKVVKSDVDGWDVQREGEEQALTNHATREEAEEAAKVQQEVEEQSGDGSGAVDVRQGPFSDGPGDDLDVKKAFFTFGTMMTAVIILLVVLAIVVALTGIGGD
jgi:hypothetical protein